MTDSSAPTLHTPDRDFPLHQYHLALNGKAWTILHTGVILTHADESQFFKEFLPHLPYGVALWPASIALAYELAELGTNLAGKTLLELGAGTGLPGIVAASFGAKVVQTDRQELPMSVCRRNSETNKLTTIEHRIVDWTDWHDETRYDWIIGSDILYSENMHDDLEDIFDKNLAESGRILISDPFRGASLHLFESLMGRGWNVEIAQFRLGEGEDARAVGLFTLSRQSKTAISGQISSGS